MTIERGLRRRLRRREGADRKSAAPYHSVPGRGRRGALLFLRRSM